ncbi:hypothetical protein GCM10007938_21780 [Vibrio zhanjiangensis]|uniref:Uncharacterized protein n=1 Tax=Vibrio zhanjiangensis TaxID=1046128 RepID=A0ABQ6EZE2_9VIBR|nr:hypothetical protein [Vibrio zhanjiangensis]GLT18399.1 hypothetical protein GCM10007938_21780 [Vibrio zhanjiangensis]
MVKEIIHAPLQSSDVPIDVHDAVLPAELDLTHTVTPLTASWNGLVEQSESEIGPSSLAVEHIDEPEQTIPLSIVQPPLSLDERISQKIELISRINLTIADKDDDFERYESLGNVEAENNEWRKRQEAIQARNKLTSELILLQEEKINQEIISSPLSSIAAVNQLKEELLYLSFNTSEIEVDVNYKIKIFLDAIVVLLDSEIDVVNKKILAITARFKTLMSDDRDLYQKALAELEERKALMIVERDNFKFDNAEELALGRRFRDLYKINNDQDLTSFEESVVSSIDRKLSWGDDRLLSEQAKVNHSKWATFVDYIIAKSSISPFISLPSIDEGEEDVMVKFFTELDEEIERQELDIDERLNKVGNMFDDLLESMARLNQGDIWTRDMVLMNNDQVEPTYHLRDAYAVLVHAGGFEKGLFEKLYSQIDYPTVSLSAFAQCSSPRHFDTELSRSHFITSALSALNPPVKPDDRFQGYEEIPNYFHRTADMTPQLTKNRAWSDDISAFGFKMAAMYPNVPIKENDFDEIFMYIVGKSLNTDDTTRVIRTYCYRGIEGTVFVYVRQTDRLYQFAEDTVTLQKGQSAEVDGLLRSLFVFPDGQQALGVYSEQATTGIILPRKKRLAAGDLARRHYNGVFFPYRHEQQPVIDNILALGLEEKYAQKINDVLANNRASLISKTNDHLKMLELMEISAGTKALDDAQKNEIRRWLREFSNGTRKASLGTAQYVGKEQVSNPDLIFINVAEEESQTTEGLLVNLRLSMVIPIPREFIEKLELYGSKGFKAVFADGFYSKNRQEIKSIPFVDTGWLNAIGDLASYSQALNVLGDDIPMKVLDKALRRVACYCMRVAFGFESPTAQDISNLNDIFQLRNQHKSYEDFFRAHIADDGEVNSYIGAVNFKAGMNQFISLLRLHKSSTWRESREEAEQKTFTSDAKSRFANMVLDDIERYYKTEWDDEVVSYSEEWWKDTIEWWRTPLRIGGYTIASVLAVMFPGLSAGIIAGIATTFITDTALDIGLLGVEDDPVKKEKLMQGIIVKTLGSIGGEVLGGAGAQLTAKTIKRLLLKRASIQLQGGELAKARQSIESYSDDAVEEVIHVAKKRPKMPAITKLLAQKGDGLPRINKQTVDMQNVINRYGVPVGDKINLFRRLKNFYKSNDKTATVMQTLEGITILTLTGEIIVLVEDCLSDSIKDNEFYQIFKLVLLYGIAAGATTVSSMQRSPELLEIEAKVCLEKLNISQENIALFSQSAKRRGLYNKDIMTDPDFRDAVRRFDDIPQASSAREKETRRLLKLDKLSKSPRRVRFDPLYLRLANFVDNGNINGMNLRSE